MTEYEVIPRPGHNSVQTYVESFVKFLYARTGYNFEDFRTPQHLQRLLDEMAFNRVPLAVWNGLLTVALRIANMSSNIYHTSRHFGAFFVDALVWLARKLVRMGLLQISIFLFNWFVNPIARVAIGILFYAIDYLLYPLWTDLSSFIQSRLISAPYYHHFLAIAN